ncbi:hypothetical protein LJR289_001514 [Pseudoduganella sp. LjRoot289]|uniref:hypothetical protein n=1 Tax=Pseudoduganella sp. LjRoot289 TaxID=3342314 RepID=UPI003ECED436
MAASTDKDYIDAKLEGTSAHLLGEVRLANAEFAGNLKEYQAQSIARMDMLDQTIKSGILSARDELNTKLALIEANVYRVQSEIIRWVVGAIIGGAAVTISATSFLLSSAGLKCPPASAAPVVVYAQPAPAEAAPATQAVPANRPK